VGLRNLEPQLGSACLPVVGDRGLVGIVARVDILRGILRDDVEG